MKDRTKKIYFAGSIRGGRDDMPIYNNIINYLNKRFIVLTEHIGDKKLNSLGEVDKTDKFIYERDIRWIKEADFIIAEVTNPSLGVGYEIAYAESLGKPIICLYRKTVDKKLSAMISGNKNIKVCYYNNDENLYKIIDDIVKDI